MADIEEIKKKIYQIAAITDRGQRLNKLIAPMYQEKSKEIGEIIDILESFNTLDGTIRSPLYLIS